jgi:parallel beta-helix repeat protein
MAFINASTLFALCVLALARFGHSLDVVVGTADCGLNCANYYKAGNDAHPAIQKALNDVNAAGGGKVYIAAGNYVLSKNFEMFSNTHLSGAGMDMTVLKLKDYAAPWKVGSSSQSGFLRAVFKYMKKCENLKISSLTLDGNKLKQNKDSDSKYGRYGFFTEGCINVFVDSVKVKSWQGYGFDPHGWKSAPGGPLYGQFLTILNSVSVDNDWDGFTLDQTNGMYLRNNTAIANGRHGFNVVTGSSNVTIEEAYSIDNGYFYYTGSSGCGMVVQNNQEFGTHGVTIRKSVFKNDKKGGICTNDVYDVTIINNTISTTQRCMYLLYSNNFLIKDNICDDKDLVVQSSCLNIVQENNVYVPPNGVVGPPPASPPPTSPEMPDSECSSGILDAANKTCCALSCGTCGGLGCGLLDGGSSACCESGIAATERYCDVVSAPCIMGSKVNPAPAPEIPAGVTTDPTCQYGIKNKNICCDAKCGTCGGTGCSQLYGGAEKCCTKSIATLGNYCTNSLPPCIIV